MKEEWLSSSTVRKSGDFEHFLISMMYVRDWFQELYYVQWFQLHPSHPKKNENVSWMVGGQNRTMETTALLTFPHYYSTYPHHRMKKLGLGESVCKNRTNLVCDTHSLGRLWSDTRLMEKRDFSSPRPKQRNVSEGSWVDDPGTCKMEEMWVNGQKCLACWQPQWIVIG